MNLETERKNVPPRGHSAGISLVEILVSMAVGILLLIGLTYIFAGSSRSNRELHRAGHQIENARYATIVLTEDIRHAGYYGEFYRLPAAGALPDPCAQTLPSLATDIAYPIQGYDSPTATPISSCLPTSESVRSRSSFTKPAVISAIFPCSQPSKPEKKGLLAPSRSGRADRCQPPRASVSSTSMNSSEPAATMS